MGTILKDKVKYSNLIQLWDPLEKVPQLKGFSQFYSFRNLNAHIKNLPDMKVTISTQCQKYKCKSTMRHDIKLKLHKPTSFTTLIQEKLKNLFNCIQKAVFGGLKKI